MENKLTRKKGKNKKWWSHSQVWASYLVTLAIIAGFVIAFSATSTAVKVVMGVLALAIVLLLLTGVLKPAAARGKHMLVVMSACMALLGPFAAAFTPTGRYIAALRMAEIIVVVVGILLWMTFARYRED